jgi:hypothetical protein
MRHQSEYLEGSGNLQKTENLAAAYGETHGAPAAGAGGGVLGIMHGHDVLRGAEEHGVTVDQS